MKDIAVLLQTNTEKIADDRLIRLRKSPTGAKRKRSPSEGDSEHQAKWYIYFSYSTGIVLFLALTAGNRSASELETLRGVGWKNVSSSPLKFLGRYGTKSGPSRLQRRNTESELDTFLGVLGVQTLQVIAERIQIRRVPSECLKFASFTARDVARFLGVHFLRASEANPLTAESVYASFGCGEFIGIKKYRYMLSLMSRFDDSDLLAVEASLRQGFQDSWNLGLYRTVDELVYEYTSGKLTVYMPRKPHPVGHLYYLMCTKSEGGVGSPVPYCYDFLGRYSATPLAPAMSAPTLVERSHRGSTSQRPVVITDSAFGTDHYCQAMEQHDMLYVTAVPDAQLAEMHSLVSYNLPVGSHRLFMDSRGQLLTAVHGEVEDKNTGKATSRIMVSKSNAFAIASVPRCSCARFVSKAQARVMRDMLTEETLKFLCIQARKSPGTKDSMIQCITGWDLTLGEDDVCPHCHDPSARLVIADPETWQEQRESLAEELREKSVPDLKSDCSTLRLSTAGNKDQLIDRLVAQTVASDDPLERHQQYFDHLTCGSSDGSLPDSYVTYRANFNSVDMFNRRLYSLKFPKAQSEILHLFVGQIHVALTNALAIRNFLGETCLADLRTVVGRGLLVYV